MASGPPASLDQVRATARVEGVRLAARTLRGELGNSLATTMGWAELLADDPALPEHARQAAAAILASATRAAKTVHDLEHRADIDLVHWGVCVGPTIRVR
jgi:signal transduction histidine kinase